jgi:hypothetical protein
MPVDSLGQLHDFLRSQRLIRRREHGNDEPVHPAGSQPSRLSDRRTRLAVASDRRSARGHAPELNPDFRAQTCARQL